MKASLRCGEAGAVYVEMLIVFWPLLLLWLGLGQLGMIFAADILVTHAAARAVRAAIVILPDDKPGWEERYSNVAPLTLGGTGEGLDAYACAPPGGRLAAIRRAAQISLSSLSPSGGDAVLGFLKGYAWTNWAVAVTFPSGESFLTEFSPTQLLTARVTYLFPCVVPVVASLMCSGYFGFEPERSHLTRDASGHNGQRSKEGGLVVQGLGEGVRRELESVGGGHSGAGGLGASLRDFGSGGFGTGRFLALCGEATMPMQGRRP